MKQRIIFLLYETDEWLSRQSFILLGISENKDQLIHNLELALTEADALSLTKTDVENLQQRNQTQCRAGGASNYVIEACGLDHIELGGLHNNPFKKEEQLRDLSLPKKLKELNDIAVQVIDLFESLYEVKRIKARESSFIACWKIRDAAAKKSAYLYLQQANQWTIEPLEVEQDLPDCFDFDVVEFCDSNFVHLEDLYESLDS